MRNAALFEDRAQFFRLRDRRRSYQHRLTFAVNFFDLIADRAVLCAFRFVNDIGVIHAYDRHIRRHHHHRQFIYLEKFIFLGLCRARHARQLVIHSEIILECDRRQRLRFALNADAFLRLDRLVQSVGISPPLHQSTRKLIDDYDLIAAHNVITIAFHQRLCAERRRETMRQLNIFGRIQIAYAEHFFNLGDYFVFRRDRFLFFVNRVIDFFFQARHRTRHHRIHVRRLGAGSGYYQRRPRLVYQNRINFVDDRIMQRALNHLLLLYNHVVAQIIKAELIVGAERHITTVRILSLRKIHIVQNQSDR